MVRVCVCVVVGGEEGNDIHKFDLCLFENGT